MKKHSVIDVDRTRICKYKSVKHDIACVYPVSNFICKNGWMTCDLFSIEKVSASGGARNRNP